MIALPVLIHQCVPHMVQASMQSIVQVESKGNPFALNLNNGYKLQFQPKSEAQAKKWIIALEKNDYNFDIGLAQVNIKNVHKYGYNAVDLLNPCISLKLGSKILVSNYHNALPVSKSSGEALQKAISAYNTGNFHSGFNNGYVHRVYAVSKNTLLAFNDNSDIPPIISSKAERTIHGHVDMSTSTDVTKASANPYSSRSLLYIQQRKITLDEFNHTEGAG